ncbi:MAG: hypothetical protein KDB65_00205 [Calditrichaeota bacterium]|nr:hypothetical protein [Calditrichota bacterium]MCB9368552.1 hypothetical protein [Calditrichota bacterium]
MSFRFSHPYIWLAFACLTVSSAVRAGVTNPDISVIGQMRTFVTDDPADVNRDRPQMSFDETELMFDAALNPFARGTFVFAVADEAIEVEEGFLTLSKGLPDGLGLKFGKYRVGFGKLNAVHPHAYPFPERFNVLAEYLPGEESYNEIGGQVSYRLPLKSDLSSTVSLDVLQGNSFHPDEEDESRLAVLGRWANFFMLNEESSMEIGVSGTQGVNNVAAKTTTSVYGVDAKAKLWFNQQNVLALQGEFLALDREDAEIDETTGEVSTSHVRPVGGYLFADMTVKKRYNFGARAEHYQRPVADKPWDQAVGVFAGLALMEETTLFRLNWDRFMPDAEDAFNTFTFQAIFSMGPHKPHQF